MKPGILESNKFKFAVHISREPAAIWSKMKYIFSSIGVYHFHIIISNKYETHTKFPSLHFSYMQISKCAIGWNF